VLIIEYAVNILMIHVVVDRTASPPGGYSQYIPAKDSGIGFHRLGPPLLPPHLLDTVLNKEVPLHVCTRDWSCEVLCTCMLLDRYRDIV